MFWQKDYQQLFVIKEMVANLNMPLQIIGVNTGRAKDGLALSSRNGYLTDAERLQAPTLYQTLTSLQQTIKAGNRDYQNLLDDAKKQLNDSGWQVEYIELRNANTLQPAKLEDTKLVILAAARLGKTRLIDNIEITL